ncbi:MAG: hypothetical protein KGI60_00235 [Patescibacteria group bacterium]|nr:hypothetical protein [Patescibacteria group bacterium]
MQEHTESEHEAHLIEQARNDMAALQEKSLHAIDEKKTTKEEPLLLYHLDRIRLDTVDAALAHLYDLAKNATGEVAYRIFMNDLKNYRLSKLAGRTEGATRSETTDEEKSIGAILDYLSNLGAGIIARTYAQEDAEKAKKN